MQSFTLFFSTNYNQISSKNGLKTMPKRLTKRLMPLTPVVIICTFPAQCIYVFLMIVITNSYHLPNSIFLRWRAPQQMLQTHRSLKAFCATLWWRWLVFLVFPCNVAPVELNWQGKTEVLGEKPVPVPLCPPQIPHGLIWDRTRSSAVRGRRLTAWAMARPPT